MNQLMGVQSYHQFGHFLNPEEINTMSMMDKTITGSGQSALSTNKVLRNTYTLLSMTHSWRTCWKIMAKFEVTLLPVCYRIFAKYQVKAVKSR